MGTGGGHRLVKALFVRCWKAQQDLIGGVVVVFGFGVCCLGAFGGLLGILGLGALHHLGTVRWLGAPLFAGGFVLLVLAATQHFLKGMLNSM